MLDVSKELISVDLEKWMKNGTCSISTMDCRYGSFMNAVCFPSKKSRNDEKSLRELIYLELALNVNKRQRGGEEKGFFFLFFFFLFLIAMACPC